MTFKPGSVVNHLGAQQWGAGLVVEIIDNKATIQFSDGVNRKIAASHYSSLELADPKSFMPPAAAPPASSKPKPATKARKTKK
jgi:hypothetical protein